MKKFNKIWVLIAFVVSSLQVFAQKKFTEGTIYYDIVINTGDAKPKIADMFDGATSVVYIKGSKSRSEMVSSLGTQSTIIDSKTGSVIVLKEYGAQKYMIQMTQANWREANKKYEGVTFTMENEFKTIAGYKCQKAIGKLKDGSTFTVYFTPELIPENYDFQYPNKSLPGLALEYESSIGSLKVTYTVSKISFNPVPALKFDPPKSGFRIMTYEESRNAGR
jgi:GLPGLI family protein